MKTLKNIIITIALLFCVSQTWAQVFWMDFTADGLNYKIIAPNEVQVATGDYSGFITVPGQVENEGITYNVTQIGDAAFNSLQNLQKLTISEGITTLANNAIKNCPNLSEVNLPSTLSEIGLANLTWCANLMRINFPDGNSNFVSDGMVLYTADRKTLICASKSIYSENFVIPEGVETIGSWAFDACTLIGSFTLPSTLKTIGKSAFISCAITSIDIPKGVQTIEEKAFAFCEKLSSISIPDSLTLMETQVFQGCKKLASMAVAQGNTTYKCIDDVLFTIDGKTLVHYPQAKADTVYSIPEGVTRIGDWAFNRDCDNLTGFNFPQSLTHVGEYAFVYLTNVKSLNIPATITNIGVYGFSVNRNVTSLTVAWTNPNQVTLGVSAMGVVDNSNFTLYVPQGSKSLYQATYPWSRVSNIVEYTVEKPSYTLTFAGEEIDIQPQIIKNGNLATRPENPERTDFNFNGWFTDNETFENEWNFGNDIVTQDTTLYAKWEPKSGITETESAIIKVYPNPAKEELRIERGELQINKVEIVDLSGKMIYQVSNDINQVNVSALSQGIYFVKIETDKGIITEKFVKE